MANFEMTGRFRVLAQGDVRWLALEPSGENLATFNGETLVLEFEPDMPEAELQDVADKLNEKLVRGVFKVLGA